MPLLPDREEVDRLGGMPGAIPDPVPRPRPGALDVAAAAFRQGNIVSSAYDRLATAGPAAPPVEDYDPLDDIGGYEDYAERFLRSQSPVETQAIKQRIRMESADHDVIRRAGGWGLAASFAAGAVDPATLASMMIPVTAPLAYGSRAARIGAGMASQVALDTASEVAFHATQETRTLGESMFNIGAGTILTGVFGAVATRVPKSEFERLHKQLDADLNAPFAGVAPETSTAGAMRVGANTTLEDETIAKGGQAIASTLGRISPLTRLLQSPVKGARVLAQELADVPFALAKNLRGIATPISLEARVKQRLTTSRMALLNDFDTAYTAYRKRVGEGALSLRRFGEQVSGALRRGDAHEIPEAGKLAARTRAVFEADKKLLQEFGALPEEIEVLGARSYFPRVYDHHVIAANRADFEARLRQHFTANPKRDAAGMPIHLEPAEIEASVQQTVDNIMGTVRGMADVGVAAKPGPLKTRVLDVPDEVLEPYLVSDFEHVMNGYFRAVVPQIEFRRAFGSTTLENEIGAITDEYRVLQSYAKDNATKEKLRSQQAKDINDLVGLRDRVLGQVGPRGNESLALVRAQRLIRSYNYVRLLGGQTLSSLADYGRVVSRYGLVRTGRITAKFLTNIKANRLTREDAKRLGTALEWTIDTRGSTLADIGDELAGSKIERFAQWSTQKFTRITGMATWNSSLKAISTALEQDAVLRAARKGSLSPFEKAKFAQNGIGDDMLRRIGGQFEQFGDASEGLARARTELWSDREAAATLESAIVKSADILVLTRGAGDLPLFMDKEIAKTIAQFKSFGMASVNRLLVPMAQGLAHGDAATANGLAAMLGLGALTYLAKETAAGREIDLAPERIITESLNWSGVLTFLPDLYDPAAGLVHAPRLSRYGDRAPFETLMGPTLGTAEDVYRGVQGMTDLGVSEKDIHRLRKLLPLQNVFYLRRLIDAMEEGVAESVGADEG